MVEFELPESWREIQDSERRDRKSTVQFWCFFTVSTNEVDQSIALHFLYYLPKYKQYTGLLTNSIV